MHRDLTSTVYNVPQHPPQSILFPNIFIVLFCLVFTKQLLIAEAMAVYLHLFLSFFFSSRRRHTRFKCDWSSDVCSSDLLPDSSLFVNAPSFLPTTEPKGPPRISLTPLMRDVCPSMHRTFGSACSRLSLQKTRHWGQNVAQMRSGLQSTDLNSRVNYHRRFHKPSIFRGRTGSTHPSCRGPSIAPRPSGKRFAVLRCRLGFARTKSRIPNRVLGDSLPWPSFVAFSTSPLTSPLSASFFSFALFPSASCP